MDQTALDSESNSVLTLAFNQDYTSLGVGHKRGYKFFSLTKLPEQPDETYTYECDGVHLVERLFQSSLVTLCTLASPRKMRVFHMRQKDDICAYNYSNSVLAIRMNRQRLVVVLEDSVHIHHIRDLKILHAIRDTPRNPTGLSALSANTENCYLAYPGSATVGEVQIFDAANLSAVTMIPAHEHALAALAFDSLGTRLATASGVGTVIRLFAVPSGAKLAEFSRGLARSVLISSVAFSADSRFLAVSSNTETVHVFQVAEPASSAACPPDAQTEESAAGSDGAAPKWGGYLSRVLLTPLSYLPTPFGEVWNRDRDFATARLPRAGVRNVCAIISPGAPATQAASGTAEYAKHMSARDLLLLVASLDGCLHCFKLDSVAGGECTLLRTFRLDETLGDSLPSSASAAAPIARRSEPVAVDASLSTSPSAELAAAKSSGSAARKSSVSQSPPSAVPGQPSRASSRSYADAVGVRTSAFSNSPPSDCDSLCKSPAPASCLQNVTPTAAAGGASTSATRAERMSEFHERDRPNAKGDNTPLNLNDPQEFPPFAHQVPN